jgi:hypothetical protein
METPCKALTAGVLVQPLGGAHEVVLGPLTVPRAVLGVDVEEVEDHLDEIALATRQFFLLGHAESPGLCVAAEWRKEGSVGFSSRDNSVTEDATRRPYGIFGYGASVAVVLPGKFIFLAQPHTGSSAMVLAFQDAFPEALDLRPHHMSLADVKGLPGATRMTQISRSRTRIWDDRPHKRRNLSMDVNPEIVHKYITGQEHVFTVIRNPYDFLATCFVRRGGNKSFEAFVRGYRESPYIEDDKMYYHVPDCDSVLHWEKMPLCIDRMMRKLGLPELNLERHNVTKDKKPWPEYYSAKAFDIVNRRFGEEFSRFYKMRHE